MELEDLYNEFLASSGIVTDTRQPLAGKLFFALKGPNFNGNEFAIAALEQGALLAVVDDEDLAEGQGLFFVDNALATLQELATYHRARITTPVLAVVGSNGKTTTKELIAAALSCKFNTTFTKGNLNNHIGLPLTILGIKPAHEMAVVELGANTPGETALLCKIANPDFGVITNIGKDHLEGFGSVDGVQAEYAVLFQHLKANKGLAFVNTAQPLVAQIAEPLVRKVTFPGPDDFFAATGTINKGLLEVHLKDECVLQTNLPGLYNLENVAAALCIAKYFDVDATEAQEAIAEFVPTNNRSQIVQTDSNLLILDAYNANPSSMQAALESLVAYPTESWRKTVILGDMNELGTHSAAEHTLLGQSLNHSEFAQVFICGPAMLAAKGECSKASYFATPKELEAYLAENKPTDRVILIKGSRSLGLEKLVSSL